MEIKFDFKLEDKSAQFKDQLEKVAERSMRKVARRRVKIMQAVAPAKTGRLRKGYGYKLTKDGNNISVELGGSDFKTWWYEVGTIKLKGLHIVENGFSDIENEFNAEFVKAANRIRDLT